MKSNIEQNISLKPYNTFGIEVLARNFITVQSVNELQEVLALTEYPEKFILGGGSNMLLTKNIDALVVHIDILGKDIVKQDAHHVEIQCMAGENWHEFVLWCIDHDLGGLENMSLIPGKVGATPIQNIGAYGTELKDIFISCDAIDTGTGQLRTFAKEECNFGYRNSIFKNQLKGKYVIISVNFRLTTSDHKIRTSYGAIEKELAKNHIVDPTIKEVSDAVIAIRQSKLPDPNKIGNSGSFFKNPVVTKADFDHFYKSNPAAPFYTVSDNEIKIPAGWLIEQAGFKGKRFGDAGVHKNQALVLVNYDNASGNEIWELAQKIQKTVREQFGILIEAEVNIF